MSPITASSPLPPSASWLVENGPRELELLFRAIVYHPAAPILIVDSDRNSREASTGAGKLLGLPREKIIGRKLDAFADPSSQAEISEHWKAFLATGEQEGTLRLGGPDGSLRDVAYTAKGNVLPVRHVLVLKEKSTSSTTAYDAEPGKQPIPGWVQDYALFLVDVEGRIVTWYAGAERIYGYAAKEAIGQHVSFLHLSEESLQAGLEEVFKRSAAAGHFGNEGWRTRKDGTRFWANAITMALKDENGDLQGFANVVRDFSDRHERDEKLRRSRARDPANRCGLDHRWRRFR